MFKHILQGKNLIFKYEHNILGHDTFERNSVITFTQMIKHTSFRIFFFNAYKLNFSKANLFIKQILNMFECSLNVHIDFQKIELNFI